MFMPTRRRFCQSLAATGLLPRATSAPADAAALTQAAGTTPDSPHLGNLYPFVQQQADRSPLEQSFLHSRFRDLASWQKAARARVLEHLFYAPPPAPPSPDVVRRTDRGDYIEEYLTFQTTPDLRVPAYVLIPKKARPSPGWSCYCTVTAARMSGARRRSSPSSTNIRTDGVQTKPLRRREHRHRAGAPRLRGHHHRHVLLGRAPHAAGRGSAGVSGTRADDGGRHYGVQPAIEPERTARRPQPDDRRHHLARRDAVGRSADGRLPGEPARSRSNAAGLRRALSRWLPELPPGGTRPADQGRRRRRLDDLVRIEHPAARRQYRRPHLPYSGSLPLSRSAGSRRTHRAPFDIRHQWIERLPVPTPGGGAGIPEIEACFRKAGMPERQRCRLFDAPHQFNLEMQAEAWDWLGARI